MEQILENNEYGISRYLITKAGKRGIPLSGGFELTSRCNFNCKMCYVHSLDNPVELRKKELSVDEWVNIAQEAKEQGMLFLLLTGGEAMLRDDFIELYSRLAQMGFHLVVNSNGSLLSKEILDCFRKYPPGRVNISVYGASNQTYQDLCGNQSFGKVKRAIHQLRREGISVRVTMMLTPYNVNDMEMVYQIAQEEDALCEMSSYMFPQTRVNRKCGENRGRFSSKEAGIYMARRERMLMGEDEFCKYLEHIDIIPPLRVSDSVKEGHPVTCQAGNCSFWITWDGKMKPCGLMMDNEVNVLKEGFKSAWSKINQLTKAIRLPKECVTCDKQFFCHPCPSVCQAETGCFDGKPTYMCELVEAKIAEYKKIKQEIFLNTK